MQSQIWNVKHKKQMVIQSKYEVWQQYGAGAGLLKKGAGTLPI